MNRKRKRPKFKRGEKLNKVGEEENEEAVLAERFERFFSNVRIALEDKTTEGTTTEVRMDALRNPGMKWPKGNKKSLGLYDRIRRETRILRQRGKWIKFVGEWRKVAVPGGKPLTFKFLDAMETLLLLEMEVLELVSLDAISEKEMESDGLVVSKSVITSEAFYKEFLDTSTMPDLERYFVFSNLFRGDLYAYPVSKVLGREHPAADFLVMKKARINKVGIKKMLAGREFEAIVKVVSADAPVGSIGEFAGAGKDLIKEVGGDESRIDVLLASVEFGSINYVAVSRMGIEEFEI